MKILFSILCSLLLPMCLRAQNVVMSCDAANVLYESIDNPISVAIENGSSNIIVETNNGILIKAAAGKYIVQHAKPGMAILTIKRKMGSRMLVVGERKFRVKDLPLPVACIGNKVGGGINKSILIMQQGIVARMTGFDFETNFKVTRFNIMIIRNGATLFNHDNIGNRFDDAVKTSFQLLAIGDQVFFNTIYCIGPDKRERAIGAIEFTIIP